MSKAPIITLKAVKHSPSLFQETEAFTATICVDGVKAGYAENHGTGGMTNVRWDSAAVRERVLAHIKTLPAKTAPGAELGLAEDFVYEQDEESVIDDLLNDHLNRKTLIQGLKRLTKGNMIAFNKVGGTKDQWFTTKLPYTPENVIRLRAHHAGAVDKIANEVLVELLAA